MLSELSWLYGKPAATGIIKSSPQDFIVQEKLGYELDGEGEHLLVYLRKTGCNTRFVAEKLAEFANIAQRAVSYAGLKDRHAVTEQWFSLHLPGKESPDWQLFHLAGCEVLLSARHQRKLRIGALKENAFQLVVREISDQQQVEQRLEQIMANGVPNYFGEQRFGFQGNNIQQALRWAKGEIKVKERSKRSFYLSAVRSELFNQIASRRIQLNEQSRVWDGDALQLMGRGSWFVAQTEEVPQLQQRVDNRELLITASLPGTGELGTRDAALAFEQNLLNNESLLLNLLQQERVEAARRAMLVYPGDLSWCWLDNCTLSLSFTLPAGSFATSVVRELVSLNKDSEEQACL